MLLKHLTLKDADALTAACVEWAWARAVVACGRVRSLLCATCGYALWRR